MQPVYPKAFIAPAGRVVSIGAKALRQVRANPSAGYRGWDWFEVPGYSVLQEFRRGLHDRINRR